MNETKTYNGWTNYETWLVKLWMDNDEGSCHYWQEETNEVCRHARSKYSWQSDRDAAVADLADRLKSEHEGNAPTGDSGVYADLLNAAFSEVNWHEIAEALIEDSGHEFTSEEEEDPEEDTEEDSD